MADRDTIERILASAIVAAGPMGSNAYEWRMKIQSLIPEIAAVFEPDHSREWQRAEAFLGAQIFSGIFQGMTLEESSKRYIVRIDAGAVEKKTGEKKIDELRTDRVDNYLGKSMLAKLQQLQPGDEVIAWRVNEKMQGGQLSVRVLYRIVKKFSAAGTVSPTTPPQRSAAPAPTSPSAPGPHSPRFGEPSERVHDAFERMTARQRVEFATRCRDAGIAAFMSPDPEDLSRVLTISEEVLIDG
jgi:hypothetical protein